MTTSALHEPPRASGTVTLGEYRVLLFKQGRCLTQDMTGKHDPLSAETGHPYLKFVAHAALPFSFPFPFALGPLDDLRLVRFHEIGLILVHKRAYKNLSLETNISLAGGRPRCVPRTCPGNSASLPGLLPTYWAVRTRWGKEQ